MIQNQPTPKPRWKTRIEGVAIALCLFFFVLGANWTVFERFGSDMPDWDQWQAETQHLLIPWFEHDHFVQHLFTPQNEHRVVLTKLQNLAVVLADGQWDARVECFFNAFLHGFIAVLLWNMGRRWLTGRSQLPFFLLIAALYGLPLPWQNLIGGFHSQQYWLILLSTIALTQLPFARQGSGRWWAGLLSAILALGAMASGFFAAIVVMIILAWRWTQQDVKLREVWQTLLAMTVLIAIGAATRVEVNYHEGLKAATAHDFFLTILRCLAWPFRDHDWVAVVLWVPWTIFALACASRLLARPGNRPVTSRSELTVIALGGWVLAQILATGYARGAAAPYPASRYMDTMIVSTVANALAVAWIVGRGFNDRRVQPARVTASQPAAAAAPRLPATTTFLRYGSPLLAAAWIAALVVGLNQIVDINANHELPDVKQSYLGKETHLRSYISSKNPADLSEPIPYPSPDQIIFCLGHPSIIDRMPPTVRTPLPLRPAPGSTGFVAHRPTREKGEPEGISPKTPAFAGWCTWGSFNRTGSENTGTWRSVAIAPPNTGWLRFETAGQIGEPGVALDLRDASTDELLANIRPSKVPGDTWRTAYVRSPQVPFVVFAKDTDPRRWLAFTEPAETPTLAYWSWFFMNKGLLIAEIFGAIGVVLVLLSSRRAAESISVSGAPGNDRSVQPHEVKGSVPSSR